MNEWLNEKLAERVEELELTVAKLKDELEAARTNKDKSSCRMCLPKDPCALHIQLSAAQSRIEQLIDDDGPSVKLERLQGKHVDLAKEHAHLKERFDASNAKLSSTIAHPDGEKLRQRVDENRAFIHKVAERLGIPRQHPHERMLSMLDDAIKKLQR